MPENAPADPDLAPSPSSPRPRSIRSARRPTPLGLPGRPLPRPPRPGLPPHHARRAQEGGGDPHQDPQDPARFPWSSLRYVHTTYVRPPPRTLSPAYRTRSSPPSGASFGKPGASGSWPAKTSSALGPPASAGLKPPSRPGALGGGTRRPPCGHNSGRRPRGTPRRSLGRLLYGGGLRRSEIVALDLDDVQVGRGEVRSAPGRATRPGGSTSRRTSGGSSGHGSRSGAPILAPSSPGSSGVATCGSLDHRPDGLRCHPAALREAGIARVSPHDFRRTTATVPPRGRCGPRRRSGVLGHASISTTLRYDLRGEAPKREAACRLRLPGSRRRRTLETGLEGGRGHDRPRGRA